MCRLLLHLAVKVSLSALGHATVSTLHAGVRFPGETIFYFFLKICFLNFYFFENFYFFCFFNLLHLFWDQEHASTNWFLLVQGCIDGKHVVVGRVVEGMQLVHAIEKCETDGNDRPIEPIVVARSGELELVQVEVEESESDEEAAAAGAAAAGGGGGDAVDVAAYDDAEARRVVSDDEDARPSKRHKKESSSRKKRSKSSKKKSKKSSSKKKKKSKKSSSSDSS